ncbi:MAG TPA: histidine kinase [Saprospiraceae bacterium]|nr:histidine kinase [Saprospiraceae bacterium]
MIFDKLLSSKIKNVWLRYNVQYFFKGLIIGTCVNILFFIFGRAESREWRNIILTYIVSTLITLAITNVYIVSGRISKRKFSSPIVNVALNYLIMAIGVIIGSELSFVFVSILYKVPFSEINQIDNLKFNLSIGFLVGTVIYISQLQRDNYDLKLLEKDAQLLKLNELKTLAELKTLQARINPHFLYNALNSITSLIHEEPDKAEGMTLNLAKLFRYSLNTQDVNFVPVKEELDIVNTYLDIERVRFRDRLRYEINADKTILSVQIPRFILQPLVENALKHGLNTVNKEGLLTINIKDKKDKIEIAVMDNGSPFPDDLMAGYGLQSSQDKLNLLYGDDWKLNYMNTPEKKIVIVIPKKPGK